MTRSKTVSVLVSVCIFLICVLFPPLVLAEEVIDNDYGYSLDLPEGFSVAEYTQDGFSYRFVHDKLPVSLILKLYTDNKFNSSEQALSGTLDKLSAKYEIDKFQWRNVDCAISSFEMKLPNTQGSKGWSVGVPLVQKNAHLVLLCYADLDKALNCEQFIISSLNSLAIDRGSYFSPGIITTYAFSRNNLKDVSILINGKNIKTQIDADDNLANQFVVDCEFAVMSLYANDKNWVKAWQRYYRAIYRDSYSRLKKVAFDINSELDDVVSSSENPNYEIDKILLNWVQGFDYKRDNKSKTSSDFTNLIDTLLNRGSDCDSRSMLMCVLLNNMGIDSVLFVSREYSHAIYGADVNAWGAKIKIGEKEYLLGETTASDIAPGLIAKEYSDTYKWIPVGFN